MENVNIPNEIKERIIQTHGAYIERISKVPAQKIVSDVLNLHKPKEQIEIIQRYTKIDLRGKRLLEIGSGYGIFNVYARKEAGIDAWGIEPGSPGFDGSYQISQDLLKFFTLSGEQIVLGAGEHLPFADNSFDIVYSTNVLEHVDDPRKVLTEAVRVCKEGGSVQIVVPNFGSFFDGHYASFYFPYLPKKIWKLWLKYVLRRDPAFADTLRTEINYFSIMRWLKPMIQDGRVTLISTGEEIFLERMRNANFSDWAGLGKIKKIVSWLQRAGLNNLVAKALLLIKAQTPLIITLKKNTQES